MRGQLRGQGSLNVGHQLVERNGGRLRVAVGGEVQQVVDHHVHRPETGVDLFQHVQPFGVAGQPAAEHAQIERYRHEVVADFVGHVRRHLTEVGQAVLAGQLAVLDLQFVGELLDLVAQRGMRLFQADGGRVPGGQDVCRSALASNVVGSMAVATWFIGLFASWASPFRGQVEPAHAGAGGRRVSGVGLPGGAKPLQLHDRGVALWTIVSSQRFSWTTISMSNFSHSATIRAHAARSSADGHCPVSGSCAR